TAAACADRLFRAARRYPGCLLPGHTPRHRHLDAGDGARRSDCARPAGRDGTRLKPSPVPETLSRWFEETRMRSVFTQAIAGAVFLAAVAPAGADFKVRMPDANPGEIAIEPLGDYGHDPKPAHSGELSTVQEFEYGVNGFWRTELELEQERDAGPGQSFRFSQVTSENFFQ